MKLANYITNEEFLSLWATLKDKDAEITRLQRIEKAAQAIIKYQTSGAKDNFAEWEVLFGDLEKSLRLSV